MGKARKYIMETMGISRTEHDSGYGILVDKYCKKYQVDAEVLVREYLNIQNLATEVLGQSADEQVRQKAIDKIADFCYQIAELDKKELFVFIKSGRQNALRDLLELEYELRNNYEENFENLEKSIKMRLSAFLNYSFASTFPAGSETNYDTRQLGSSFIYSILPSIHGIDMGAGAVAAACAAKERAGEPLTDTDKYNLDRHKNIKSGQMELKNMAVAKNIEKMYNSFIDQNIELNRHNGESDFVPKKLNLTCAFLNTMRENMYAKHTNPQMLAAQVSDPELKVLLDCLVYCEQPSEIDYGVLQDSISIQPVDTAFACYLLLYAYGHDISNIGNIEKYFRAYNVGFNNGKIAWGQSPQVESHEAPKGEIEPKPARVEPAPEAAPAKKAPIIEESIVEATAPQPTETLPNNAEPEAAESVDLEPEVKPAEPLGSEPEKANILEPKDEEAPGREKLLEDVVEILESIDTNTTEEEFKKRAEETVKQKAPTREKGKPGRKPVDISGWLYTQIKQEYLNDSKTTDEMRAQFANMTHEEQFKLLHDADNYKYIRKVKAYVQRAIDRYEDLSPEEKKKIDDLSAGYELYNAKLSEKKAELKAQADKQTREIRERTKKYKQELRASRNAPAKEIEEFFRNM